MIINTHFFYKNQIKWDESRWFLRNQSFEPQIILRKFLFFYVIIFPKTINYIRKQGERLIYLPKEPKIILKRFLKFGKIEPRDSYKLNSYKKSVYLSLYADFLDAAAVYNTYRAIASDYELHRRWSRLSSIR